jgi:hypothetical protein
MKHFHYMHLGILPTNFAFCMCEKSFKSEMKKIGFNDVKMIVGGDATCHTSTTDNGNYAFVCIELEKVKSSTPDKIIGLVVHECTHAWQFIRKSIGEKKPSAEFEAYIMQALVQFCINYVLAVRS